MNFVNTKSIEVITQMGTFLPRVYQVGCNPSVCSDDFVGKSDDFVVFMRACSYIRNMLCISMGTVLVCPGYVRSISGTVPGYDFGRNSFGEQLPILY